MHIPAYHVWMLPMLQLMADKKEYSVSLIDEKMAEHFTLDAAQKAELLPSGSVEVYKSRSNWARVYLMKAGLIARVRRAVYVITERGLQVLQDPELEELNAAYLQKLSPDFASFIGTRMPQDDMPAGGADTCGDSSMEQSDPSSAFEEAFEVINGRLIEEFLQEIRKIAPIRFEAFVLDLLKTMGYGISGKISGTRASRDGGIDGVIYEDKLSFRQILVQIKHYAPDHKVQRQEVQAFVGAIAGTDAKGLFVTSSEFTDEAVKYAEKQNIILLTGRLLARLMIEHNFGVSVKKVYEIKAVDHDLFDGYIEE